MIERTTLTTPDGGTVSVDRGYHSAPADRPYHIVTCGVYVESIPAAQEWINRHWNQPQRIEDAAYARMEASFGEWFCE